MQKEPQINDVLKVLRPNLLDSLDLRALELYYSN